MTEAIRIKQRQTIKGHIEELSELLKDVVDEGASIGFLPPLDIAEAQKY